MNETASRRIEPMPLNPNGELNDRVRGLSLSNRLPDENGPRFQAAWLPWVLMGLLAFSTLSLAIRLYTAPPSEEPSAAVAVPSLNARPTDDPAPMPGTASSGEVVVESRGYIIPARQVSVSPIEVSGRIKELYFKEGMRFKKGDVLAVLEATSYEADLDEARNALAEVEQQSMELQRGFRPEEKTQAEAELKEAEASLKQLRAEYLRTRNLKAGAVAQKEFEQAESAFLAAEKKVLRLQLALELIRQGPRDEKKQAALHQVEQQRARVRRSEWRLKNCTITAPIDGTILSKKAEVGNLLNPLAFAATSGSLCDMADLSDLEVEVGVQEREVAKIFQYQRCRIRADAYPNRLYEGYVDRLMPIANRAKGEVQVRVKVKVPPTEEEGRYLKPEMSVLVSFFGDKVRDDERKKGD